MIYGHVRDGFPRVTLTLPGRHEALRIEFVVDTGFEGELSLPPNLAAELEATLVAQRPIQVADGTRSYCPLLQADIEWSGEFRTVEVLVIDNAPLLGAEMMAQCLVTLEMQDGGEVSIEPL